jgi:hypothetical protein
MTQLVFAALGIDKDIGLQFINLISALWTISVIEEVYIQGSLELQLLPSRLRTVL